MMTTELERIVALETLYPELKADITEIKNDVKTLVAISNRQKGMAALGVILWTALVAGAGFFASRR